MGKQEQIVRKRKKKQNIQRSILSAISIAGVLSLAALAPNALRLLKYAPGMRSTYVSRIVAARKRLEARGLLRIDSAGAAELTDAGAKMLQRLEAGAAYKKPARWDGSWRIVIFDIAERRRPARDRLRAMLMRIGFRKLQHSVWIYPYDCEDLIVLLKTDFALGREVLYIVSDSVEGEQYLKHSFKVS
jgi:DNA-binding transcriptional regulator PaaX